MFIFNSFLVPIIWIINPWYLFRLGRRWYLQNSKFLTQEQANQVMEDPPFQMGKRYGEVLEGLWFNFLYLSLIPLGSILTCIGLILHYWIDKYNLLRKSSIIEEVSADLCMKALFLLDCVLIFKPLG